MRSRLFDFLLAGQPDSMDARDLGHHEESLDEDYFELNISFKKPPIENYAKVSYGLKVDLDSLPVYRRCDSPSHPSTFYSHRQTPVRCEESLQKVFAGKPACIHHSEQTPPQRSQLHHRSEAVHAELDRSRQPHPKLDTQTSGCSHRRFEPR